MIRDVSQVPEGDMGERLEVASHRFDWTVSAVTELERPAQIRVRIAGSKREGVDPQLL